MIANLKPLYKLYNVIERLSDDKMWLNAIDNRVKEFIIDLNTNDQLFDDGIDSLGRGLGDYAPFTVVKKQEKGQRYDHITLKDTGKFYNSWTVKVNRDGLELNADDFSHYDEPLFEIYGEEVLGLTEENKRIVAEIIKENYINYVRREILR